MQHALTVGPMLQGDPIRSDPSGRYLVPMQDIKTLTFFYTYHMGGWGDLLKGLHTCWCLAKVTGRELRIDFSAHLLGSIFPQYAEPIERPPDRVLDLIDRIGAISVSDFESYTEQSILVTCNWFSPGSVRTVPREVVLGYFEELYNKIFPIGPGPTALETFDVLHCRAGDKYLSEAYACKTDDRLALSGEILNYLRPFIANETNGNTATMICSDLAGLIGALVKHIPNSFCLCPEPYHFAYKNENIPNVVERIQATILEHFMMTRSQKIWMTSRSGFPITAAMIGNVPLYLQGQTYRDEYVDFVRELRSAA